ncbi:MAG: hypothetical protein JXR58_12435 [Bacteroidales bacterium]|nr:hypothetical protein [Bacteroidales bacterium]
MEGKWEVKKHYFTFYNGYKISLDTMLYETGVFNFKRVDEYGGTFTFSPSRENRAVTSGYSISSMSGTYELIDLKTNVVINIYPSGGGMPYKDFKIVDFGRKKQIWYADNSLNIESGANETLYLEKTK